MKFSILMFLLLQYTLCMIIVVLLLLLSKHILCKENIVIMATLEFEIFKYLHVLRSLEFIYAIFMVMYVCVCETERERE